MNKNKFYSVFKILLLVLCGVFCFYASNARADEQEDYKKRYQETLTRIINEIDNAEDRRRAQEAVEDIKLWNTNLTIKNDGIGNSGTMEGCKILPVRLAEVQACLLCPMFSIILKTDQTMATMSFGSLSAPFMRVIIVVLALFIAYHTLLSVSALTKQEVGKYLQIILIQTFKVLLAAILLSNATYVYHYVINPLMRAGLDFGLAIINPNQLIELNKYTGQVSGMPEGVISNDLLAQVLGTVRLFSNSAAELPVIGSSLMCVSVHSASPGYGLPDFSMFLEGLICWAFGWMIALSCCFYLLDCVVRFGIFCTLLPFLIACWPFKVTQKYVKAGWDIFMNTFFNFVMMGLIISFTSQLIVLALTGGDGNKKQLMDILNGDAVATLKEYMSLDGTKFLILMAACIFAFKLVGQVGELANKVSSTSGPTAKNSIGGHLGGLAANAAKKVGTAGLKVAGKATGVSGAVSGIKDRINARNDAFRSKFGGGSKTNINGNEGAGGGNSGGNSGGSDAEA